MARWAATCRPSGRRCSHAATRGRRPSTAASAGRRRTTTSSTSTSARAPGDDSVARPLLVLFHGLEGSSASHYARAFANWCRENGWRYAVPHFRGCSGELNLAPRAYHSGDFEEIGWVLARMRAQHHGPIVAVGVSLGGNALLRWAEEAGESASQTVRAVCAVCSPHRPGGRRPRHRPAASTGRSTPACSCAPWCPRPCASWRSTRASSTARKLQAARDLYDFDNIFTAPLHGFRNTEDYWARGSAKPHLHRIRIPALVLNARNDPFVPAASLPGPHEVGAVRDTVATRARRPCRLRARPLARATCSPCPSR